MPAWSVSVTNNQMTLFQDPPILQRRTIRAQRLTSPGLHQWVTVWTAVLVLTPAVCSPALLGSQGELIKQTWEALRPPGEMLFFFHCQQFKTWSVLGHPWKCLPNITCVFPPFSVILSNWAAGLSPLTFFFFWPLNLASKRFLAVCTWLTAKVSPALPSLHLSAFCSRNPIHVSIRNRWFSPSYMIGNTWRPHPIWFLYLC